MYWCNCVIIIIIIQIHFQNNYQSYMDFSIDYANPSKLNDLTPFPYPPTWGMGA
jgi:hypothetical protein